MWPFPLTKTFPLYEKQSLDHFSSWRTSFAFLVNWILFGSAVLYILLATFTESPQMSKWSLQVPITPVKNCIIFKLEIYLTWTFWNVSISLFEKKIIMKVKFISWRLSPGKSFLLLKKFSSNLQNTISRGQNIYLQQVRCVFREFNSGEFFWKDSV